MQRTGILGGSFNPIHNGHIAIAEKICQNNLAEEVWLMVSPQNPLKKDQALLDDQLRLQMAQLAVKEHPGLKVSDFEFHMPRPSYMFNTLEELSVHYPDREFTLIIGADNWNIFRKWYRWEDIIDRYSLIVYPRHGFPVNQNELPQNVHYLSMELYPISSTDIRQSIQEGKDMSEWLNASVEKLLVEYYKKNRQ